MCFNSAAKPSFIYWLSLQDIATDFVTHRPLPPLTNTSFFPLVLFPPQIHTYPCLSHPFLFSLKSIKFFPPPIRSVPLFIVCHRTVAPFGIHWLRATSHGRAPIENFNQSINIESNRGTYIIKLRGSPC